MKKLIILFLMILAQSAFSQWEACNNGLTHRRINLIAANSNCIYIATDSGLFSSTNNGINWILNDSLSNNFYIGAIAVNGDNLYAATGYALYQNVMNVYFSSDDGKTWLASNKGLSYEGVEYLLIKDSLIFASCFDGIYVSTDNGKNWILPKKNSFILFPTCMLSMGNYIFLSLTNRYGIYYSTDNGQNWEPSDSGLTYPAVNSIIVAGNNIIAGTNGGGIFISKDTGTSWAKSNAGLGDWFIFSLFYWKDRIFAGTANGNIFESLDSGRNWAYIIKGLTASNVVSIIVKDDYIFAATTDSGIFRAKLSEITTVEENKAENPLMNIFPNPTDAQLNIELTGNLTGSKIQILDLIGNCVKEFYTNEKTLSLDIGSLSDGIYFVKAGNQTKMFVKD